MPAAASTLVVLVLAIAAGDLDTSPPFAIEVVDDATGRGVPPTPGTLMT